MDMQAYLDSLGCSIDLLSDSHTEAAATSSHFGVSSGNLSAYIARMACLNANLLSGDGNPTVLNNSTNSGPSVGSSSLVTDANSTLVGGSHVHRGGSANMDSNRNLPSSPLSFSSNNFSTEVIDASSKGKPTCYYRDQNSQVGDERLPLQLQIGGTAIKTTSQTQRGSHHSGKRKESGIAKMSNSKKPRLDKNQENILQQKIIQLLLQKQDTIAIQNQNQLLQALMQQHNLQNDQQQYILNSVPQFVGIPAQQQLMRHHLQQQVNYQIPAVQPHDAGICSRRLMQYIHHLRHRPQDNSISYWRKFVAKYYAPGAKERWCLSLYDSIGGHALGVFSHSAMPWHCDICGSKSGKGFEAVFEILPRLIKMKFESGVIDELLFLDFPHEVRFPSGLMMLRYGKAVQESVYEQFRVVREGQLRVIFSPDLKILSWEFCAQHHEELVPRSLVAPQVNQLIEVARKCQSTTEAVRSNTVLARYLQSSCSEFVKEGRQLSGNLELLLVNDLGFPKRYVRFFQMVEVVNYMKELMTFSRDNKIGPIESLKTYARKVTTSQTRQMHETEWLASAAVPSSNTMNEKDGITTVSEKAGLALKQGHSCSVNSSIPTGIPLPLRFLGPQWSSPQVIQSPRVSDLSTTSQLSQDRDDAMHETEWLASAAVPSSNTMDEKDGITTVSEKAGLALKQGRSCSVNSSIPTGIPLYARKVTTSQTRQMHETEWLASAAVPSSNNMNEKDGITTVSEKAGLALKQGRSCSVNSSIPTGIPLPLRFLDPQWSSPQVIQSPRVSDLSTTSQLSQDRDDAHNQKIQNIVQQMVYNSRAKGVQSGITKVKEEVLEESDGNQVGKLSTRAWAPANVLGSSLGRSNYFDTGFNSSGNYGENGIIRREAGILERFQLPGAVQDLDYEFFKSGVLNAYRKA